MYICRPLPSHYVPRPAPHILVHVYRGAGLSIICYTFAMLAADTCIASPLPSLYIFPAVAKASTRAYAIVAGVRPHADMGASWGSEAIGPPGTGCRV